MTERESFTLEEWKALMTKHTDEDFQDYLEEILVKVKKVAREDNIELTSVRSYSSEDTETCVYEALEAAISGNVLREVINRDISFAEVYSIGYSGSIRRVVVWSCYDGVTGIDIFEE